MAKHEEPVSGIYGKPNFKLIVALFAVGILVVLVCGWLFLRSDALNMRGRKPERTGMTIVLPMPALHR